jgi:hypothetical protein
VALLLILTVVKIRLAILNIIVRDSKLRLTNKLGDRLPYQIELKNIIIRLGYNNDLDILGLGLA